MSYKPVFIALLSVTLLAAMQTTTNSTSQAAGSQAGVANAAENAQIRQLANARANDAQALRDDIKRMRALVGQMETNLAFVDTTQSPLKHQFQLDIDMWNVVINHMERRAYPNSR
jgi:GTP1/Obg family GTP-binding protein